jgi:hypothetical protein
MLYIPQKWQSSAEAKAGRAATCGLSALVYTRYENAEAIGQIASHPLAEAVGGI